MSNFKYNFYLLIKCYDPTDLSCPHSSFNSNSHFCRYFKTFETNKESYCNSDSTRKFIESEIQYNDSIDINYD